MLTKEQISFLKEILNTNSPSGCEGQLLRLLRERMQPFCEMETDAIGNLYMYASRNDKGLKIMITAHADEVGFQVTFIDEKGYIFFRNLAGVDTQTIPGSEVVVLTKHGNLSGVIGKKSPHIVEWKDKDKVPRIEEMWIDCGFSSDLEANQFVSCGDYITFRPNAKILVNKNRIISKALDNKISVFILAEVIKELIHKEFPCSIVGVATTQEELGCRGSIIAANKIKPDVAFCLDVGIATDIPNMSFQQYGRFELGKGVGVIQNANNNNILVQSLIKTAVSHNISYQVTIGHRPTGGTEASQVQLSMQGVATANLSIPNRYMHSFVEMCDLNDIENAIMLLIEEMDALNNSKKENYYLY